MSDTFDGLAVESALIKETERRREPRIRVRIPLLVYGYTPAGDPFLAEAHTIEINSHGALITFKSDLVPGERLLLTNETNGRVEPCTIRTAITRHGQDAVVAVAFSKPVPQFWRKAATFREIVRSQRLQNP